MTEGIAEVKLKEKIAGGAAQHALTALREYMDARNEHYGVQLIEINEYVNRKIMQLEDLVEYLGE